VFAQHSQQSHALSGNTPNRQSPPFLPGSFGNLFKSSSYSPKSSSPVPSVPTFKTQLLNITHTTDGDSPRKIVTPPHSFREINMFFFICF
jgi:hypothetical protein